MSWRRMVELKQDIRRVRLLKKLAQTPLERKALDRLEYILTKWKEQYIEATSV